MVNTRNLTISDLFSKENLFHKITIRIPNSLNSVFFLIILAIYKELRDTGVKYRNRIRSRISNLKDLKNPNLRKNVLLGIITPDRLAVLSAEVSLFFFVVFILILLKN